MAGGVCVGDGSEGTSGEASVAVGSLVGSSGDAEASSVAVGDALTVRVGESVAVAGRVAGEGGLVTAVLVWVPRTWSTALPQADTTAASAAAAVPSSRCRRLIGALPFDMGGILPQRGSPVNMGPLPASA